MKSYCCLFWKPHDHGKLIISLLLCINEKLIGNSLSPVDQLRQQSIKIQYQH